MPLARVSLRRGKSTTHRKAILDGVYRAMRETFDVPDEDRFMVISEHDEDNFSYSSNYLDIKRSDAHREQHADGGKEEGTLSQDRRKSDCRSRTAAGRRLH